MQKIVKISIQKNFLALWGGYSTGYFGRGRMGEDTTSRTNKVF
jgi:hypothetical protein